MKLKEAQMLGVLALIAVGIILLCMWGGGSDTKPAPEATTAAASSSTASEPDLAELYNDLLTPPADGSAAASSKDATVSMAVGGKTPAPLAGSVAVREDMIERTSPDKIPLTPVAAGTVAPDATLASAALATTTHTVRSGETLSTISQKYYGTKNNWQVILDANSGLVKSPKDLKPNMKLVIPAAKAATARSVASGPVDDRNLLSATTISPTAAAAAPAPAAAHAAAPAPASATAAAPAPVASSAAPSARTHTVAKGDTLFRIALKYYNDGNRYKDVLAANRSVLSSPQDLRPGMKLVIP